MMIVSEDGLHAVNTEKILKITLFCAKKYEVEICLGDGNGDVTMGVFDTRGNAEKYFAELVETSNLGKDLADQNREYRKRNAKSVDLSLL